MAFERKGTFDVWDDGVTLPTKDGNTDPIVGDDVAVFANAVWFDCRITRVFDQTDKKGVMKTFFIALPQNRAQLLRAGLPPKKTFMRGMHNHGERWRWPSADTVQ